MQHFFWCIILIFCTSIQINAQEETTIGLPIEWSFEAVELEDNEYELIITAKLEEGWSIYSQDNEIDKGPYPTSFEFDYYENVIFIDNVVEGGSKNTTYDDLFQMNVSTLSKTVVFVQRIQVLDDTDLIEGFVSYMAVNQDKQCLPPREVFFEFSL